VDIRNIINRNRTALFGFAALLIYAFHGWKAVFADVPGLYEIENFIRHYGDVGVDIFLFLSGMGLVNSWKNCSSYKEFIIRRFKRVLVPSIIAGFAFLIVNLDDPIHAFKAISGFYYFTGRLNMYLWFFFTIVLLYLFFPIYYECLKKARSQGLFTAAVIALWLLFIYLLNGRVNDWAYICFNRIPIFLTGTYAYHFTHAHKEPNPVLLYGIAVVFLTIGYYLAFSMKEGGLSSLLPHSYALFPYMMMSLSLILLLSRLLDHLPHRILDFYGLFTFEFYCVQERILQLLENIFNGMPVIVDNLIVLGITTACAYVVYLVNYWIRKQIKDR
jgi:peptidoglycan/LPS O-acetylase OafA/YrhL